MPAIRKCPRCHYSLKGLPEVHACPECGLAYDEVSCVYRMVQPATFWGGILFMIPVVLLVNPPRFLSRITLGRELFALLMVGLIAWRLWGAWSLRQHGQLVAVMADGLFVRMDRPGGELIPWSHVERAEAVEGFSAIDLILRGETKPRRIDRVFRSGFAVHLFIAQVDEKRRLFRPDQE